MKLSSFLIPLTVFSIMLGGCNDDPVAEQAATAIPSTITPSTVFTSPLALNIDQPQAFISPLATVDHLQQHTVPDPYLGERYYQIHYSNEIWRLELDSNPEYQLSDLIHRDIEGCRINLRFGPRDVAPDATVVEKTLGGYSWQVINGNLYISGENGDYPPFILRLVLPYDDPNVSNLQNCQLAAETVLATMVIFETPTEQIIVADAYERMYHYQFAYSPQEWQLEMDAWHDGSAAPELLHLAMEGCRMILRDGARGQSTDVTVFEKILGGLSWFVSREPQFQPNVATYILPQPDKGIAFFVRLTWPEEASEEIIAACQAAAEEVITTFSQVE